MPTVSRQWKIVAELAAIVAALLAGKKVYLFANDINPDPSLDMTQFVEPTGAWYTAAVLTPGTAFLNSGFVAEVAGNLVAFAVAVAYAGETIYGYYVADAAGPTDWDYAARFTTPKGMRNVHDGFAFVPRWSQATGIGPSEV